ncbi:hypothetical protein F5B19DRAFT_417619 [Rostrohypoxylon terebratum]|nr:hypothetical protein F5B19DRAFT_417619 [Rostrohypoxylon terebratum]
MGRKPNPVIVEYFERGPKLNDNSNRYHHRCKACGEDFPKGRSDSLTAHLVRKCPAISQADRVNVCLTLNGLNNNSANATHAANVASRHFNGLVQHQSPISTISTIPTIPTIPPTTTALPASPATPLPAPLLEQSQNNLQLHEWNPLETLAEASRQFEANDKHDDHADHVESAAIPVTTADSNPLEFHEQYTLDNPPTSLDNHPRDDNGDVDMTQKTMGPAEKRLREILLKEYNEKKGRAAPSALSAAAAAATARLDSSPTRLHPITYNEMINYPSSPEPQHAAPEQSPPSATPWEGMTYISEDIHAPATVNAHGHGLAATLNKGGRRMHTGLGHHGKNHSRAKFNDMRRKEVQEIRKIGACVRCKILRKNCSLGTPCDACKKVSSPRVWKNECIRAQLCDEILLYSAGVQAVMSQKRINGYKNTHHLEASGLVVEVTHFPDTTHKATFQMLRGTPKVEVAKDADAHQILLLDINAEDITGKVEAYMRAALPQLINHEASHYIRVTLNTAVAVATETGDELLKKALELWGVVELMDLERQWRMRVKSPSEDVDDYMIEDAVDSETYTNICLQLTAASERKAAIASKNLLGEIRRRLQDGKIKNGFPMFLVVILFLNCIEKTTWAFKVWEEKNLRPKWPLEKPPGNFTQQGESLANLLRVLLKVRKFLPKLVAADPNSPIAALRDDSVVEYFQNLQITEAYLQSRQDPENFQPDDSRSLEFLYSSRILLPDEK